MASDQFASDGRLELISFEIAGQAFCIDIGAVREIRGWTQSTRIPHAPSYLLGVINLRGAILPVVDLRARLGLGVTEASSRHVIVVIQHGERTAGLIVDAVRETFVTDIGSPQPPPAWAGSPAPSLVDAVIAREDGLVSRLVLERLVPGQDQMAA